MPLPQNLPPMSKDARRDAIVAQLKTVYDPEIPVDVYELGLIYDIEFLADDGVRITMTLTSPMCPVADKLPMEVQEKVASVEGVSDVDLRLTYDPPWSKERMSEEARLELDMF